MIINQSELLNKIKEVLKFGELGSDLRYVNQSFLDRACKTIETKNINEHHQSISWVSMLSYFKPCIVCYNEDNTVNINYTRYVAIRNMLKKYGYCFEALYTYLDIKYN